MKNKISAYLVVYNEEKKIESCLKSLRRYVEEIIVIHDGKCDDGTLEICKKYNCNIFVRKHIGEAEPHRPFALKKCRYEWVLQIDADERLSNKLAINLRRLVNNESFDAYRFNWRVEIGKNKSIFLTKQVLFRKEKMYALGLPHFQAETKGRAGYVSLDLLHDTKEFDSPRELLKTYIKKDKEWGKIAGSMLLGSLNKIPVFNCHIKDKNVKQIRKIKLMKNYPLIAIFLVPLYSFLNSFFKNNGYKRGFLGFVLSCHVPLFALFTCSYLIKKRFL